MYFATVQSICQDKISRAKMKIDQINDVHDFKNHFALDKLFFSHGQNICTVLKEFLSQKKIFCPGKRWSFS